MKPLEFSIDNCADLIDDARRRKLAQDAREYADTGRVRTDWIVSGVYWNAVLSEHERIYWMDVYDKRMARIARMAERKITCLK